MKEKISYEEQKQVELDNFFRKKDWERQKERQWGEIYDEDHIPLLLDRNKIVETIYTEHDVAIWRKALIKEQALWRKSHVAFDSYVRKTGATKDDMQQAHWDWNLAYKELKLIEEIHGRHEA